MAATLHTSAEPIAASGQDCFGCKRAIDADQHGLVIALRDSLWHMECFVCSTCKKKVHPDMTLLILADGSPVCMDCTYQCAQCKEPIQDEAVMTGELTYHSACFKCQSCHKKIEDLVFAKTSTGIYCMPCHNEKAAKSRRAVEGRKRSKRKKERVESDSPAPPMPPNQQRSVSSTSSAPSAVSTSSTPAPTPASSTSVSANGPSPSPSSPTSTNFYTPTGTPFLDASAEFPSAKRGSVESAPSLSLLSTLPQPPRVSPDTPSLHSYLTPTDASGSCASSAQSSYSYDNSGSNSIGPQLAGLGVGLFASKPEGHPHRRSMFLFSEPQPDGADADGRPRCSSFSHPPSPPQPRALSPVPPISTSSSKTIVPLPSPTTKPNGYGNANGNTSPNSLHSPYPSPTAAQFQNHRAPSPSLMPPSAHSFPPSRRSHSRSRSPSPYGGIMDYSSARSSFDDGSRRPSFDSSSRAESPPPPPPPPKSPQKHRPRQPEEEPQGRPSFASATGRKILEGTGIGIGIGIGEDVIVIDGPSGPPPEGEFPEDGAGLDGVDGDEEAEEREEEERVEQQSEEEKDKPHKLLVPPALPPMRFSLYGTDFSDLLSTVNAAALLEGSAVVSLPPSGALDGGFLSSPLPGKTGSSGGSTASVTPTGLRHVNTDITTDITYLRPTSASAPAGATHFETTTGAASPSPTPSSPRASFSHSDAGEEEDVLSPMPARGEAEAEEAVKRLREALGEAEARGMGSVRLEVECAAAVLGALEGAREKYALLKAQYDGVKRKSQNYVKGLNVAGAEYDRELATRREVEAEVLRLRVQVSDQAARLATHKPTSFLESKSEQLKRDLNSLVQRVSQLKVERDVVIAEVEELAASRSSVSGLRTTSEDEGLSVKASKSLSKRLDEIKLDYLRELEPLQQQRESLAREVQELQDARSMYLEETAALQARNDELSALNAQVARQVEAKGSDASVSVSVQQLHAKSRLRRADESLASVTTSSTSTFAADDSRDESDKFVKVSRPEATAAAAAAAEAPQSQRKFRWYAKPPKEVSSPAVPRALPTPPLGPEKEKEREKEREGKQATSSSSVDKLAAQSVNQSLHAFQQHSILRLTKCEHCAEKMWGLHLRCGTCGVVSHARCQNLVKTPCQRSSVDRSAPSSDSTVFGRDLVEQLRAESKDDHHLVPTIVQKSIDALESRGMDYEGIYRKTGGSSQCKSITQLFERGNYDSFDLCDPGSFNDISSITSVLKSYFRQLPNPLFTFALHDAFVTAGEHSDAKVRGEALASLITQLPPEHYETIKYLMLHLHRITNLSEINRMTSQNLGVVFGPTLMRSQDRSREFSDMPGEAQAVRWLIENAPVVFASPAPEAQASSMI